MLREEGIGLLVWGLSALFLVFWQVLGNKIFLLAIGGENGLNRVLSLETVYLTLLTNPPNYNRTMKLSFPKLVALCALFAQGLTAAPLFTIGDNLDVFFNGGVEGRYQTNVFLTQTAKESDSTSDALELDQLSAEMDRVLQ